MGVYKKEDSQEYNNRPVYQLDRGGQYLYYDDYGYWIIGPQANGSNGGIATTNQGLLVPPSTGWSYVDHNGTLVEDPHLKVGGGTVVVDCPHGYCRRGAKCCPLAWAGYNGGYLCPSKSEYCYSK